MVSVLKTPDATLLPSLENGETRLKSLFSETTLRWQRHPLREASRHAPGKRFLRPDTHVNSPQPQLITAARPAASYGANVAAYGP